MDFDFALWLGITTVFSVAAIVFAKHHEKLEAEAIASGDLIIIKANPKKAWPSLLRRVLPLAPLLIFSMWSNKKPLECSHFFDVNLSYIQFGIYFLLMPLLMTIFLYSTWQTTTKSLKNGFFPPTDEAYLFDTKALSVRLKRVKRKLYSSSYFLLFFTLIFYGMSVFLYQKLQFDRSYILIEKDLEKKCLVIKHYP